MARSNSTLATVLALALGATAAACTEDPAPSSGGTGGSASGTGGTTSGTGGTTSGTGGTATGTGGSVSGTGGSVSGTGGTVSGTGGSGTGGSASGTGGSGSEVGGETASETGGADMPSAGGKMMLTVDFDPTTSTPDRLCFKPEAGSGGGDKSPKMEWTPPPAGTMSLVLMTEDLSNTPTPHQIVCNMKPTETGRPADTKAMIPEGAVSITGHNKPMHRWYGPGAGVRNYEITIFALATATFPMACQDARKTRDFLKMNKNNKAVILDWDSKVLWGSAAGRCK